MMRSVKVHRVQFCEAATGAEGIHHFHGHAVLQVTLAAAWDPACGQQGTAQNQARAEPFEFVVLPSPVVVRQSLQVEVGDNTIQARCHTARPPHLLIRRLFRQGIDIAVRADLEEAFRCFLNGVDLVLTNGVQPCLHIFHFQHFDVCPEKGGMLGEVAVHIHHARIRVAEETDAAAIQRLFCTDSVEPVFDFSPC